MHSQVWQTLAVVMLVVSCCFAQVPPPPWLHQPAFGPAPAGIVDPLAGGKNWNPNPPATPQGPPPPSQWPAAGHGPPLGGGGGAPVLPPGGPPGSPPGSQPGGMPVLPPGGAPAPIQASSIACPGAQQELQLETGFPGKPTQATMYTYVPKSFKQGNPVVVALHHCAGTAPNYFHEYPDWPKTADQKGFMMIFASSPGGTGGCWDVSSKASLKHDGGGDSQTIAEMVKYAQKKYGCSKRQVYVVGHSSGAMLTQVLGATYPDLFLAGAAYSGVPAGCFHTEKAQGADWNTTCSSGALNETPEYWGQQAKAMYPDFKGTPTRMMLVHGKQDQVINFKDHVEAVKQWTYLHHVNPDKPTKQYNDDAQPNYQISVYGSGVMAVAADGVTHDNPAKVPLTCQFFGL